MRIKSVLYKSLIIIAVLLLLPIIINSAEYIFTTLLNLGRYTGTILRKLYEIYM